jgi:hypothetical protein
VGSFQFQATVVKHETHGYAAYLTIQSISIRYPGFSKGISSRGIFRFRYPEDPISASRAPIEKNEEMNFTPVPIINIQMLQKLINKFVFQN